MFDHVILRNAQDHYSCISFCFASIVFFAISTGQICMLMIWGFHVLNETLSFCVMPLGKKTYIWVGWSWLFEAAYFAQEFRLCIRDCCLGFKQRRISWTFEWIHLFGTSYHLSSGYLCVCVVSPSESYGLNKQLSYREHYDWFTLLSLYFVIW